MEDFDDGLRKNIAKMIDTMYDYAGVGLSAPQVLFLLLSHIASSS